MMKSSITQRSHSAFTIVELLVVIVVIAILAAITIVSYTGITGKAIASALQSDLDNASKQLKLYETDHGSFPTSLDSNYCPVGPADSKYCLKTSNGNTLTYTSTPTSDYKFKVVATKDNTSYYITNLASPTTGGKNLLTDAAASFEDGTVGGWQWFNDTRFTVANNTVKAYSGTHSLSVTASVGSIQGGTTTFITNVTSPGSQYTASVWVDAGQYKPGNKLFISMWDNVAGYASETSVEPIPGTWIKHTLTNTFGAGSTQRLLIVWWNGAPNINDVFYIDAIQLESGSTATPF